MILKYRYSLKAWMCVVVSTTLLILAPSLGAQKRPNILWITCEDISPTLSMYGDSTAHTPNLDKLASESTIYTNAFATVGVCAPARSSIITGMHPISIGTQNMRTGLDYYGWGKRDYSKKSLAVDINGRNVPHYSVVTPAEVRCFTEYLRMENYYCTNNYKTDYQFAAPVTAWDENGKEAHWRNRQKDQPFFSVFNLQVTHESYLWKNADKPLTVSENDVPVPDYFPDTETVRTDIARNYSNIELMDRQVGDLLHDLKVDSLLENTIIFFYSDHGGPLPRGKRLHYESGLRVPMMVRMPDDLNMKYNDELISLVDLAPTILSLARLEIPSYIQGRAFLGEKKQIEPRYVFGSGDRFDEHADRVRVVISKDYLFVKNYNPELPAYKDIKYRKNIAMMNELLQMNNEGALNADQMYWFRNTKTPEEFYLRDKDPNNLDNQINNEKHHSSVDEMREALESWIGQVGDKGVISEYDMFMEMWPNGSQPTTAEPRVIRSENVVELQSDNPAASLAYILSSEKIAPDLNAGWKIYHKPIPIQSSNYLYAMSTRIGYKDSEIIEVILTEY